MSYQERKLSAGMFGSFFGQAGGSDGMFGYQSYGSPYSVSGTDISGDGPSPSGTQYGFYNAGNYSQSTLPNPGTALDQLGQTALNTIQSTVPVWTNALLQQETQNLLNSPTFAGEGTQPLTSGAGPVLAGPAAPTSPVPTTNYGSLIWIGAALLIAILLLKD